MINYIRAELYRNFNRAYLWVYTLLLATFPLMLNVIFKVNNLSNINLAALLNLSLSMLIMPVFLVVAMIDMISCEEYKNGTLKNAVSFGISRSKLIVSKFISAVILAFISAFIIFTVFYGSGAILLGLGNNINAIFLDTFMRMGAALPLWIGAISVGIFLNILVNNANIFSFVYVGIFIILPQVFKILSVFVSHKFRCLYDTFLTTQLTSLGKATIAKGQFTSAIVIGCLYTVVFLILSIVCFKNKEIK